jgi:hypothetical protein
MQPKQPLKIQDYYSLFKKNAALKKLIAQRAINAVHDKNPLIFNF